MQMLSGRNRAGVVLAMLILTGSLSSCTSTPDHLSSDCVRADLGGKSVARVWDEALLNLIRQVVPAPTVHARNLFHTSAAMWDAWAAYDPSARGYFITEKLTSDDITADREAAMSYAAYRILTWRYGTVADLNTAMDSLDQTMASLCYRTDVTATQGDSPAALGNRIGAAVITAGQSDGSNEDERYSDASYTPVNAPLVVADPGTSMNDPNRWQPLSLGQQLTQNGLPVAGKTQTFIGSQWGHVTAFAMPPSDIGVPMPPGTPPKLGASATDQLYKSEAVEVIARSSELDPRDPTNVDIGPGSMGGSTLGTNDGRGHDSNPATGRPYAANIVSRADYERAIAEYWADGPNSETPPGHWNLMANQASDALSPPLRIGGDGPTVDRLEWDVKMYFALNGALHDAAIATWGAKRYFDSARPISMIRFMGGNGQSSDPSKPSYDPEGLPLVPGLIELVTAQSSAPGQRHAGLAGHIGDVAIRAWLGPPADPTSQTSGVGWILATTWVPYQRPTFVTPAFAGYPSGHSTFSRAGAEVLTRVTGDTFFPGGLYQWTVPAGSFKHEKGPSSDLTLEWATYADAADAAGLSRLSGGIHISADDLDGRKVGAVCGDLALNRALQYFAGDVDS